MNKESESRLERKQSLSSLHFLIDMWFHSLFYLGQCVQAVATKKYTEVWWADSLRPNVCRQTFKLQEFQSKARNTLEMEPKSHSQM